MVNSLDLVRKRIHLGDIDGKEGIKLLSEPDPLALDPQEEGLPTPLEVLLGCAHPSHLGKIGRCEYQRVELLGPRPYSLQPDKLTERLDGQDPDRLLPKNPLKHFIDLG
jgi:hypothetical protein